MEPSLIPNPLPLDFYKNSDFLFLARSLIGKYLFTNINGHLVGGIITETEAYGGKKDKACHAYNGRRTKRNEAMYEEGGIAYIYFTYGMHYLLNVVTNKSDIPEAILIRAAYPLAGIDIMKVRSNKKDESKLCKGPALLTKAFAIDLNLNFKPLNSPEIWIEEGIKIEDHLIQSGPRIGIDYAKEDALLPWRFSLLNNSQFIKKSI